MSDIISLSEKAKSGAHRTPEDMLSEALEEVRCGEFKENKKMIILTVDESNQSYNVTWMQAGMVMSQCVALCEVAKIKFLTEMEYI